MCGVTALAFTANPSVGAHSGQCGRLGRKRGQVGGVGGLNAQGQPGLAQGQPGLAMFLFLFFLRFILFI